MVPVQCQLNHAGILNSHPATIPRQPYHDRAAALQWVNILQVFFRLRPQVLLAPLSSPPFVSSVISNDNITQQKCAAVHFWTKLHDYCTPYNLHVASIRFPCKGCTISVKCTRGLRTAWSVAESLHVRETA